MHSSTSHDDVGTRPCEGEAIWLEGISEDCISLGMSQWHRDISLLFLNSGFSIRTHTPLMGCSLTDIA